LLEAGVGTGAYAGLWRELGVEEWVGVDISPQAVAYLRMRFPNGEFHVMDLARPEGALEGRSFDLVAAIDVLYHIVEDAWFETALGWLASRVGEHGYLVVSDVFTDSPWGSRFPHVRRRPMEVYLKTLEPCGLRLVDREPVFSILGDPVPDGRGRGRALFLIWRVLQKFIRLRGWYYSSLIPIILLGVGVGLNHARSCSKSFMKMFPVVLVSGWLMLFGIGVVRNMIWPLDLETDKFAVLSKVRSVVPRGTRIGSFNAGVFGYFLDDMIVINLDGVVNNAAYPYIAERKLDKYIVLVNIEYLFDGSEAIEILKQYLVDDEHWGRNLQLVFSERGRLTTMELWAVPR